MQTNPNTMRRKLRKLSAALKAHGMHDINHGGCGAMAGIVGEILELLGVPVEVVTSSHRGCSPAKARRRLYWNLEDENEVRWNNSAWDSAGVNLTHLAVRFMLDSDMYTWDSDGLIKSDKYFGRLDCGKPTHYSKYPFGDGMTVAECVYISSCGEDWNSTFNRRQIPKMREIVYQHLLN